MNRSAKAVLTTTHFTDCRRNWILVRDTSKFIDWQKVKVQEKSDEVFLTLTKFLMQLHMLCLLVLTLWLLPVWPTA